MSERRDHVVPRTWDGLRVGIQPEVTGGEQQRRTSIARRKPMT